MHVYVYLPPIYLLEDPAHYKMKIKNFRDSKLMKADDIYDLQFLLFSLIFLFHLHFAIIVDSKNASSYTSQDNGAHGRPNSRSVTFASGRE